MLSIIIPSLNEEKYLPLLLDSIKDQKFNQEYEIILADAGSKDKTIEIAKSYGCKITTGGLPAKGRNEGAKIAKGDLLLFLDADVILEEGFLLESLKKFKQEKLDICAFFLIPITEDKKIKIFCYLFGNLPMKLSEKIIPHGAMGILVKKSIHKKIKGYNEEIKLCEDHDYVRRAAKIGKFKLFPSPKVFYSLRRFEQDGWIKVCSVYAFSNIHSFFYPVKSNFFNYKFNHYTRDFAKKIRK